MYDLSRHLRDAIRVNSRRAPLYARLCDGRSLRYSRALIRSEWFSLPIALWFDLQGNRFQKLGIPIVEEEFLDMLDAEDFIPHFPDHIDYRRPLAPVDLRLALEAIGSANRSGDAARIHALCDEQIAGLADQTHVYRMTRHLLESIRRGAAMIPRHIAQADRLGIPAPVGLSRRLISLQLGGIPRAQRFDEAAAEVQVMGVPFLYHDLPTLGTDPRSAAYRGEAASPAAE